MSKHLASFAKNTFSKINKEMIGSPQIPVTLGRFNPLHIGHKYQVFLQLLEKVSFSEQAQHPQFLVILGSCGEDRDKIKNPLSFEQRVEMSLITISELLQTKFPQFANHGEISQSLLNRDSFIYYTDSAKRNIPPSLDPLLETINSHCITHKIPISNLTFYSSVRAGELGKAYQIAGEIYENTAQLSAIAKHLGSPYQEQFPSLDIEVVSATRIRNNLAENFESLSPPVFQFLQKELALSILNSRTISENPDNDRVKNSAGFVAELAKDGKMLSFDKEFGKVVAVPENLLELFEYYRKVGELSGDRPGAQPESPSARKAASSRDHTL